MADREALLEAMFLLFNVSHTLLLVFLKTVLAPASFLAAIILYALLKNRKKRDFIPRFFLDAFFHISVDSLGIAFILNLASMYIADTYVRLTGLVFSLFMNASLAGMALLYLVSRYSHRSRCPSTSP